jgi:hypothetical protein
MTVRAYASPEAFKQALEQRLRSATRTGSEFARRRQLLVFVGGLDVKWNRTTWGWGGS